MVTYYHTNELVMPICSKCIIEKEESCFYIRKDTGKLRVECKKCWNNRTNTYRMTNKEYFSKYISQWKKNNREKVNYLAKKYRDKNPDKFRAKTALYRSLQRGLKGIFFGQDIKILKNMQSYQCNYCKQKIDNIYDVDHIIPLKDGGSNDVINLQILCQSCNRTKGAKNPIEYERKISFDRMPFLRGEYLYVLVNKNDQSTWLRGSVFDLAKEW